MERTKVKNLARQIRGVSYKPEDLHDSLDDTAVILLRANNIDEGKINFDDVVYVDKSKVSNEQYLKVGDVLICASSGSKQLVGKAASVDFDTPCTFGAFCKVVRPNNDVADYLGKYFQSGVYRRKISEVAIGANINNIRNEHIDSLDIPIYESDQVRGIVEKIGLLQNIIDNRKCELSKLDELIKARFVEMFGDVVLNTKNWENYTWDNVLTIKNGKNQKDVENPKGIYPICGSGGIMNYADNYITESNSVIIGRKGNINNPILMREKFWNVDTAFGLEPNTTVLNVDYLFMFCNFFDFEILNKAVTIPSLTKADLLKIIIPIPPIELQERFADFVAQVDKSKVVVQKALDEAQILFDSLMQEYFG